jgi:hypothetical protein
MKKYDELVSELDLTKAELDRVRKYTNGYVHNWLLHRPIIFLKNELETASIISDINDIELVKRVCQAYKSSCNTEFGSNWWVTVFGPRKEPVHKALLSGDYEVIQEHFRNPVSNLLFLGFDSLTSERPPVGSDWYKFESSWTYDNLLMLLEAIGQARHTHPESYDDVSVIDLGSVDDLLSRLDLALGVHVPFPNPYPHEIGLKSSRGLISYRAIQSIYQAWRIKELLHNSPTKKVIEIGGGLGRTAFYSSILGIKDYSIIDIPITSAAQAYFLGRTLGEDHISLYKEPDQTQKIKLLPPESFFSESDEVDLIVNIDSFPEIEEAVVKKYFKWSSRRARWLLSINHETLSPFIVRKIALESGAKTKLRYPYWMRRGYVEELFQLKNGRGWATGVMKTLGLNW